MSKELKLTSPIPPSVNHYMGYRAIMRGGKPLAVPYKTSEATAFQKEFSKIVQDEVAKQEWDVQQTQNGISMSMQSSTFRGHGWTAITTGRFYLTP